METSEVGEKCLRLIVVILLRTEYFKWKVSIRCPGYKKASCLCLYEGRQVLVVSIEQFSEVYMGRDM